MRLLLLPALALLAVPAVAQTDDTPRTDERTVIIERQGDGPMVRQRIIINGDTTITEGTGNRFELSPEANVLLERLDADGNVFFREGPEGENVFRLRGPEGESVFHLRGPGAENAFRLRGPGGVFRLDDADGPSNFRFRMEGGPETTFFGGQTGPLHRVMTRFLGEGPGMGAVSSETRERMRELEREAHELAAQARDGDDGAGRELDAVLGELFEVRAEARREQAAHLRAEADAIEAALADREARREALIAARRAELLGRSAAGW